MDFDARVSQRDQEAAAEAVREDAAERDRELGAGPPAPTDEELLGRCRAWPVGSRERAAACEVLVKRYTGLVHACVRRYQNSPEAVEDLMQVGFVGLMKAINNYDPAFGNGLRSYAVPCITGEIKRHFRDKRWQLRVGRTAQELFLQMRDVAHELAQELGRAPGESELAARLGITADEVNEARQAAEAFTARSLNAPLSDGQEDAAELGDLLGQEDPEIDQVLSREAVTRHWDELPAREQRILLLRFYGNLSQEEIGGKLGISQMHVSRLQARALAHLRSQLSDAG
jgi:RNA polymerase sigma-B factor